MTTEDRFVFVTEWYDQQAGLQKEFLLEFYLADQTIDLYDTKNRRIKRGEKGKRTVRPTPKKFTNCDNFILKT